MTTITNKEFQDLRKQYDVVLPPITVSPVPRLAAGQITDWGHKWMKAAEAYGTTRGEGAVVCIMDTGIAPHPDLDANRFAQFDKVYTGEDALPVGHPHGTHCAGIASAIDNTGGVIGVAPGAGLISYRVLTNSGGGQWAWIAQAIRDYADADLGDVNDRVRIASLSLGGMSAPDYLLDAIKYAISKGVIVVAAAGNMGYIEGRDTVNYPGAYEEVITVAALNPDGDDDPANQDPASYSSAGVAVDVAAPGSNVLSCILNGGYARFSGTSMACPHVAGLCALLASAKREVFRARDGFNQQRMETMLEAFALDLWEKGEDVRTGAGGVVTTYYLDEEVPEQPEEPEEPEQPEEPEPEPPKPPKRSRTLSFYFDDEYTVRWKANGKDEDWHSLEVTVHLEQRIGEYFETAWDDLKANVDKYFTGRLYVIGGNPDIWDATRSVARFLELIFERQWGIKGVKVVLISGTDEQGREAVLMDTDI